MRNCACAILLKDERLLGRRAPHRKAYADKWDIIGGRVEEGEALESALVRELNEELGINAVVWQSLCSLLDTGPQAQGLATYHIFTVRAWTGGEPIIANHEHSALRWFTVTEASALTDLALEDYWSVFKMISF